MQSGLLVRLGRSTGRTLMAEHDYAILSSAVADRVLPVKQMTDKCSSLNTG